MGRFLEVSGLECGYDGRRVILGLDAALDSGEFVGVIGPNGSGKTTLLRAVGRVLKPWRGTVHLNGLDIYRTAPKEIARLVATVPQETPITFGFAVRDVVMMGRLPHLKRFAAEGSEDATTVARAMTLAGVSELAERPITELSGGEKQKVIIAQALAQDPRLLLLDEPTSHLDISHQLEVLALFKSLSRSGLAVLAVFQDLNLAAHYCDRLLVMTGGQVRVDGSPEEVLTPETLQKYFGVLANVGRNGSGRLLVTALNPVPKDGEGDA